MLEFILALAVLTMPPMPRHTKFSVSLYTPAAGGISGGRVMASGTLVQVGLLAAACDKHVYPFGTVFDLPAWAERKGLPDYVTCLDTGSAVTRRHLDILYFTGWANGEADERFANDVWGRQDVRVAVYPDMAAFHRGLCAPWTPYQSNRVNCRP